AADPADNRAARVTTAGSVQPATAPENSSVFTFFERGVEPREVGVPVKGRTGVGLASRGNMLVPGNTLRRDQRIGPSQGPGQPHQAVIRGGGIGQLVGALQLDADGKVIAVDTPRKSSLTRMPGAQQAGYELGDVAIAFDKEMGRDTQIGDFQEIGVG